MEQDFKARIVSLQEVYWKSYELAREIMKTSESFDIVIAVARGGMLPGRLICDFLNIKRLSSLQIRHYESGGEQMERAEILDPVRVELEGKRVLLIDDVNDTGKTLRAAVDHLRSKLPSILKTAVLHEKKNELFEADFTGEKLKKWKWLVYQWAATEDILEFLKKDGMLHSDPETMRKHLADTYGLEVDKRILDGILKMKTNYR